jgi:hypothetical protein
MSSAPSALPEYELMDIKCSDGYLTLTLQNNMPQEGLHLTIHTEIPGFSSAFNAVSWNKKIITVKIPFPERESFKIKYSFYYNGLRIPSSEKEIEYAPLKHELKSRKDNIVFLLGAGPLIGTDVNKLRVLEKEVRLEINKELTKGSHIRLYLNSPFQFNHPYWYGDYAQKISIGINNVFFTERIIADEENILEIELNGVPLQKGPNILNLKFKYHLLFSFASRWKTAALLDRIEIQ